MSSLDNIISAGGIAGGVYAITGQTQDAAAAAGYGAWVQSVSGTFPNVVKTGDRQATITLTPNQVSMMREWLDDQIVSSVRPSKTDASLRVEFGPVLKPLAVKYVVFVLAAGFLAGWFSHRITRR